MRDVSSLSKIRRLLYVCALCLASPFSVFAGEGAREVAGEIASVSGIVFIRAENSAKQSALKSAKPGDLVYSGDVINTSSNAALKILLKDRSVVDLGPSTLFKVNEFKKAGGDDRKVELQVAFGSVRAAITQKLKGAGAFKIRTPSATMGVRGTITFSEVRLPTSGGRSAVASTTFLITQGQGAVTSNGGGNGNQAPIILNPGQQVVSAGGSSPLSQQTLSSQDFSTRQSQVNSLATNSDTAFQLATNFDRAMEQQQQQQAQAGSSGNGNSDTDKDKDKEDKDKGDKNGDGHADNGKDGNKDSKDNNEGKDRAPATDSASSSSSGDSAASGGSAGPTNSIMDSIATTVETIAPQTPQVSVTNVGISGAPSGNSILTDQSGTNSVPTVTSGKLSINVRWQ